MTATAATADDQELFRRLLDPSTGDDVDALYAEFRDRPAPARLRGGDVVAARHADVVAVLRDASFGKPKVLPQPTRALRTLFRMFLFLDPPDHTRLRRVVAPFFTPKAIAEWRSLAAATAAELVADADAGAGAGVGPALDVVSGLAYPLPLRVVSTLLGIDAADHEELLARTAILTAALDSPLPMRPRDLPALARALVERRMHPVAAIKAGTAMVRYARDRVATADAPIPDALRRGVDEGALSADEAVATWVLLFIAGHETTANLITNTIHALAAHPAEAARLRADPSLGDAVVEESLRYDSPIPLLARVAHQATGLGGTPVRRGAFVYLLVTAANRDPAAFADPDAFVIGRPDAGNHVGFGHGIHFCVGAFLARLEVRAAIAAVLDRTPALTLAEPARRRNTFAVRGFESLRLDLGGAAAP